MSNGSGTVIGESNINGPFNNKYKMKDKEEESYGGMVISQSPSCQDMVNKTGGIQHQSFSLAKNKSPLPFFAAQNVFGSSKYSIR